MSYSILIVDDSPVVRHALRSSLEECPDWIVCGEAGDGQEAIEKSKELNPDLVILDLSMPGMDGLAAARELNRTQPAVLLLMFTTFNSPNLFVGQIPSRTGSAREREQSANAGAGIGKAQQNFLIQRFQDVHSNSRPDLATVALKCFSRCATIAPG